MIKNFTYIIESKKPKEFNEREMTLLFDFFSKRYKMIHPRDPPRSNVLRRKQFLEEDPFWKVDRWFVWDGDRSTLLGYAEIIHVIPGAPDYEENKDTCFGSVLVDIDYRRRGIGTKLMVNVFQKALVLKRKSIGLGTSEDEGRGFVDNIGIGIVAIEGGENRLYLEDIIWDEMEKWSTISKSHDEGVVIETFEEVPEEYLEEYCELYTTTIRYVPRGEEEWEAIITPEVRRKDEKMHREKDNIWVTKITKEPDGKMSGLTEIFYNYENNHLVEQELTGVLPEYRSRGLGKRLKAEMLFYIKDRFSDVKFITTGNADVNAPMLSINNRMGFKKVRHFTSYKFVKEEMEDFIKRFS
jgi:GNAT superfamily N-acetyltransferase